jgi:hypothetical protein
LPAAGAAEERLIFSLQIGEYRYIGKSSILKRRYVKMERAPKSYLNFLLSPSCAEVFFLPDVLEGIDSKVAILKKVEDISDQADGDNRIKQQFKKMFLRLLNLKINGCQAIKEIVIFEDSLWMWFGKEALWSDIGDDIVLIFHQELYPGKKITVRGLKS